VYPSPDAIVDILHQIHDGKTHIGEYFCRLFQGLPICIIWKDSYSITQGCNQFLINLIYGGGNSEKVQGKTDYDFVSEQNARLFVEDDQEVMRTGQPFSNRIRIAQFLNGRTVVQNNTKIPIYDHHKKPIGILGFGYIVSAVNHDTHKKMQFLSENVKRDHLFSLNDDLHYYIAVDDRSIRLTPKQAECLTYLSIGKTPKEIAGLTDRSRFTVEEQIQQLKRKAGVHSTATLIDCFWKNPVRWF